MLPVSLIVPYACLLSSCRREAKQNAPPIKNLHLSLIRDLKLTSQIQEHLLTTARPPRPALTNVPVTIPFPVANLHHLQLDVARFDLGGVGTYRQQPNK